MICSLLLRTIIKRGGGGGIAKGSMIYSLLLRTIVGRRGGGGKWERNDEGIRKGTDKWRKERRGGGGRKERGNKTEG